MGVGSHTVFFSPAFEIGEESRGVVVCHVSRVCRSSLTLLLDYSLHLFDVAVKHRRFGASNPLSAELLSNPLWLPPYNVIQIQTHATETY